MEIAQLLQRTQLQPSCAWDYDRCSCSCPSLGFRAMQDLRSSVGGLRVAVYFLVNSKE